MQEFNTVDVLRLEVETDPDGLVNLVQNPSGELGGWGWITPVPGSSMGTNTPDPTPTDLVFSGVAGPSWFTSEAMPVVPGQYVAACWFVGGGGMGMSSSWYRARFEWLDENHAVLSSSTQTAYIRAWDELVSYLVPVVVPANTAYVRLRFDIYKTNTGTQPDQGHTLWVREATVATAASSGALGTLRTNLVPNPSFETNTTGWSAAGDTATIARSSAQAASGAYSLAVTRANDSTEVGFNSAVGTDGWPVTGGAVYTFQCKSRAATAAREVRFTVNWYDADGSLLLQQSSEREPNSTSGWTTHSITRTAPSAAAYVGLYVRFGFGPVGEVHYFDAFMLERRTSVGSYFDGSTPDASGWDYAWTGTAHASASTAFLSKLAYIEPVQYLGILAESHQIRVHSEALNVGELSATIVSTALDPAESNLIRPGRRVRLAALVDEVWQPIFTGKALEADVRYELKDPKVPAEKRARIELSATDVLQPLANVKRHEGVATIGELPFVLEGAGVPWNVNGSGNQVSTATVTTTNENASVLDQVALTRDTALGYAWGDRRGVLNAYSRDLLPGLPVLLDESTYSDLDLSFSTKGCINEVSITVQSVGAGGDSVETVYGPYRDAASIAEWGRYQKDFTVTGLDAAEVDALAAAILAASATPRTRVNSVTLPIRTLAQLEANALRDLYDQVNVVNAAKGVDDVLRVTRREHVIDTDRWLLKLVFSDEGGVASPTFQPPVQSGVRPGVGMLEWFPGPSGKIPSTHVLANGQSLATADYPYLFAVYGYMHGGAGGFFNVPNYVDRFPIGAGTKAVGTTGGSPTHSHPLSANGWAKMHWASTGRIFMRRLATALWAPEVHSTNASAVPLTGSSGGASTGIELGGATDAVDSLPPWLAAWPVIRAV